MNGLEFEELKSYDDFNFSDLILSFPNPDHEKHITLYKKNNGIKFKDAEKIFDDMLTVLSDEGSSKA